MSFEGYIPTAFHAKRIHLSDYLLRSEEDEAQIALRVALYAAQVRRGRRIKYVDKSVTIGGR